MARALKDDVQDPARLEALQQTGLLDSGPESAFDRLTRLAARILKTPAAAVSLVDQDRQFLKSCVGIPEPWATRRQMPMEYSYCQHVVRAREPVRIPDARRDLRVRNSPAITENHAIAYLGVPLTSSDGHVLGTLCVVDDHTREWTDDEVEILEELTAAVITEIELRATLREVEEAEQLVHRVDQERREKTALLESTSEGIYGTDAHGRCIFLNRAAAEMLGYSPEECLGRNMHGLIHHTRADGTPYPAGECPVVQTYTAGVNVRIENDILWRRDGSNFPVTYSSAPIREGEVIRGSVVTFSDITERKREEEMQRFLSQAGKVLAASARDYAATLRSLARLSVPVLGDWCSLYVRHEDGEVERLEIAHGDPSKAELAELLRHYSANPTPTHPAMAVLSTGEPLLLPEVPHEVLVAAARDEEHLRVLEAVGMRSAMGVPLNARGRTLGVLILMAAESGRRYTVQDLAVAQEFAQRAALAVDNARLLWESQEANRAKSEFLATISHELRTPLNAVTGYTELLREGIPSPLPPTSLDYVQRIGLSARHLLHLIEEILTFSRLETGRERVHVRPVDVVELVSELRAVVEPLARDRGLELVVRLPEQPVEIRTDLNKLRQILHNLLDNAIKFTDTGQVGLGVEPGADQVCFVVWDTGIGIAPEDQNKVFEPFRQLEQSSTRLVGGTGLGLSVTLHLVQLLGGQLELQSAANQGSTVYVRLPLHGPASAAEATLSEGGAA